jgi:peptidoglycan/xylan/chitin deacetylase (PgdA/CDA1 family)
MKKMIIAAIIMLLVVCTGAAELFAETNSITTWRGNHPAAVSLTFDDNYSTQYTFALPELNARGFKGTFFVITDRAVWEWYVEAAKAGHEIAAHTVTHPYLTTLSSSDAESEIATSQAMINANVPGQKCLSFAYPYGDVNASVEALVAKYYLGARGVDTSANDLFNEISNDVSIKTVAQMQSLTDQAVSQRSWLIPMFHSFDPTQYGKWTPDMFLTYMDYLQGRTDLWIAPFGEVIKYIRERSATTISAASSSSSITITLTHNLEPAIFNYPLTVRSVVPADWTSVDVQQGSKVTTVSPVTDQGQWVVYYDAVPNGGDITLTQGASPPVALSALAVLPTSVAGGASAQGTVTLSGPAPSDGVVVSLRSNSSAATVPAGVTVPTGSTSATFTVTTTAVSASTAVTISAVYGAVARTATLNVAASGSPTVAITAPVNGTSFNAPATIAISTTATAGTGATISKVDFYAGSTLLGTATTNPYSVTWSGIAAGGYVLTAKVTDSLGRTATSKVSVNVNNNTTLPLSWATQDVGGVGLAGNATVQDGIFTLKGAGYDIWGNLDFFRYAYRPMTGDGQIIARVASLQNTDPYAKGGVMIRETLADNATHAMMVLTPANGARFAWRPTTGGTMPGSIAMANVAPPYWVKVVRSANTFTGYVSKDGVTWARVGSSTFAMASSVYVGLVVTSHINTTLCSSTMDGVSVTGAVPASPVISITAPANGTSYDTAPAALLVTASAMPGAGATVSQVDFFAGPTLVGTATDGPYSVTWGSASAGSYSLTAKVTDSLGGTETSGPVSITVAPSGSPTVTITAPIDGTSYNAPATIPISATATAGSGAKISKVEFYAGATLVGTATASPYSITWSSVAAGGYSLTAKVTDSSGRTATSAPVSVSVISTLPLTVAITAPTAETSYTAPATIPISAVATAGTGATITKVEFYAGTTLVGTATTAPYSVTWSSVAAGSYSLTAKVTDSLGATATSDPVAVTVTAAVSPNVVITAPVTGTSYTAPATVPISATATAGTGATISKVEFYAGATLVGTATTAPFSVTWSSVAAGSYSLTAKVIDSLGATATSSPIAVTVTVPVPPTVAITKPVDGAAFGAPATIQITAAATAGTGATISKVDFYAGTTLVGTAIAAPYTVSWKKVMAGRYTLTAKATDTLNATATSAPVVITVTDKRPGKP